MFSKQSSILLIVVCSNFGSLGTVKWVLSRFSMTVQCCHVILVSQIYRYTLYRVSYADHCVYQLWLFPRISSEAHCISVTLAALLPTSAINLGLIALSIQLWGITLQLVYVCVSGCEQYGCSNGPCRMVLFQTAFMSQHEVLMSLLRQQKANRNDIYL